MLQLKYPTDFFSSDCLTFSLSKPKKKNRYYDTEKGRRKKKKKKELAIQWGIVLPAITIPCQTQTTNRCCDTEKGKEKKKKGLQSSGESCDQTFVPEVLRYGDRDWPLGSPPICSVFSFRKWGFCWEIHLGIIYDSRIVV